MLSTIIAAGVAALAHGGPAVESPTWREAPSFADVAAAYPARAGGVDGSATLFCRFGADGRLGRCAVTRESPPGLGFGEAARSLAGKFVVNVDPAWGAGQEPLGVEVPIRLISPGSPAMRERLISQPNWTVKFTPAAVAAYFPKEALDRGLKTGRGVAECRVEPHGELGDCRPLSAEPEGAGFAEAAARAASTMRMSPWTQDGGPVDGATVRVPIRLTLDDTPVAAPANEVAWLQTPSGEDVLRVFPTQALAHRVAGRVDLRCRVQASGALERCEVMDETPGGWGFGSAARALAPEYRVSMRGRSHPEAGSWITVPVPMAMMSH